MSLPWVLVVAGVSFMVLSTLRPFDLRWLGWALADNVWTVVFWIGLLGTLTGCVFGWMGETGLASV